MQVALIDYGVGNLASVANTIEDLKATPVLVQRPIDLYGHKLIILPGVGNYGDCAARLESGGWPEYIKQAVHENDSFLLGICVGMQLLSRTSSERSTHGCEPVGLDLIPGDVVHLKSLGCSLPIPHVGWNSLKILHTNDRLVSGIPTGTDFYFVHSYVYQPDHPESVVASTHHDILIPSIIRSGNVYGVQFHPEKSSKAGRKLLKNFIEGS